MDKHSPTPWRVADIDHDYDILDFDGKVAARAAHGNRELADFIVEAVNVMSLCIDEKLAPTNLLINDPAVAAERRKRPLEYIDDLEEELRVSVREDAKTLSACRKWGEMYREQYMRAQRAEAERDRLRDIVRRLCDELESHYHEPESMDDPCIIREAREALGEDGAR